MGWSVLAVVLVAVSVAGAAVALGIVGVLSILRRRDRRLMQRHGLDGNLAAYHRSRLSATENNYAHIPPPNAALRRSARPGSIPAIWNTISSEEHIEPENTPSSRPETGPEPPNAKRRKSFRASFYGHSFQMPKTRRQKKVGRTISLKQMTRSPLSAITEFTDSTEGPTLAELPTEHTPRDTPEKVDDNRSSIQWPMPAARTRTSNENTLQRQDSTETRPNFQRSVSMGSNFSNAPDDPLPPLPIFDIHKHHRSQGTRTSTASVETSCSSVLWSSPSHAGTDLTIPTLNSEMQTFDFGFNDGRGSARLGVPPGRQTLTGYRPGKTGITSIRPSVEYGAGRAASAGSLAQGSLQTIDARNWNPSLDFGLRLNSRSTSARTRHSIQDYGSIFGKRDRYSELADHAERGSPPPRPASVASGNPYQWDLKPAFAHIRHSASSADSARKGHKRQNCVRITNLPAHETRNSKVEQMPDLVEEQPETPTVTKVKIPGLSLLEAGQPVLRARASLVDVKSSPSPMQNRPILLPTRPKRPSYCRTSAGSSRVSNADSDVFSTAQPSPTTPNIFQSTRQWPLSPTPSTSIKMNSNTPPLHDSPTLPSPINATQPRKSLVKGPRHLPASGRSSRTGSPSPATGKNTQKKTSDGLRKSVMMMRSMNSEGRALDQYSRNYRNLGVNDDTTNSTYPTTNNLSLFPTDRRNPSNSLGPSRSKMSMTISPSVMSVGATSIWEDASVRGDSPEPDLPTPKQESHSATPKPDVIVPRPRTPQMKIPYDPEAYENLVGHSQAFKDRKYASPQGKGLGIVGAEGRVIGTPGSLYDRDGFLKD